jgi:hypothetical protein
MNMMHIMIILPVFLLAGCGEYQQSVPYENGGYQSKQDQRVWDSESFMHDQSFWRQVVNERTQRQNETMRSGN